MDPNFRFDVDSSEDEAEAATAAARKAAQSPWELSSYAESVVDEHECSRTTSIDQKISYARRLLSVPTLGDASGSENTNGSDEDNGKEGAVGDGRSDEEEVESAVDNGDAEELAKSGSVQPRKLDGKSIGESSDGFFSTSEDVSFHSNSFIELNLSRPLLRACDALGYQKPTPIQAACIPLALAGRDICGSAITGSGKTAAFTLPVLERLLFRPKRITATRVLILTPTRELAAQVHSMIEKLAQYTDIRCCLAVGGLSTKVQEAALRSLPDIVVATPGRIIDHLRNSISFNLEDLSVLILDEADRLLELGFSAELQELVRFCPKKRQTMLFSATMTEEINQLIKLSLKNPVRLEADPSLQRPTTLTEEVVRLRRAREVNYEAVLLALCTRTFKEKTIIFSGTKQSAHRLMIIFGLAGLKAAELHGNLTQAQRLEALERFRRQEVDYLIATDVAARGLDIVGVKTVINFACPRDVKTYLHRVGRTARAGKEGYAVTFVSDESRSLLKTIAKKAGSQLKSRIVAEKPVVECSEMIRELEDQISAILQEEREERAIRKAEMEASKVENMILHKEEIFSRPKRTWFATEKEKKLLSKNAKEALLEENESHKVLSVKQAEELKLKEKKRREWEKNLPRKKRRKLEARREMMENMEEDDADDEGGEGGREKPKKVQSIADVAYRRAKLMKAATRGQAAGKPKKAMAGKRGGSFSQKGQSRREEMMELFESDMSEKKQSSYSFKRTSGVNPALQKFKGSFKSKSRYKRKK